MHTEKTIDDFILELQAVKPSLRKLPLVIITENGSEQVPSVKIARSKHETFIDDATKMVLTYKN